MPDPNIWGPLLGLLIVFSIVGPSFAGLTLLVTKHPRTRYFWIFALLYAVASAVWLASLVRPARLFGEVFSEALAEQVWELDYELDRQAHQGVLLFRFAATPETVRELVRVRLLQPAARPVIEDLVPTGLDTADWWPPPWASSAEAYHHAGRGIEYRRLEEWLLRDPSSQEIRYVMAGRSP